MNALGANRSCYHLALQVKQEERKLVACFHGTFQQLGFSWQVREMERSKEAVPGGCYLAGKFPQKFEVTCSECQKVKVLLHRRVTG